MNDSDKLEEYKKEIRSTLIPFQKGCYLTEFNKVYRELIGKRLPIREFGFNSDIEFLYSIPDVVKITPTRSGEYHLQAVADEKSWHIQKMVSKQKPSKSKPSSRTIRPMKMTMPPRFLKPPGFKFSVNTPPKEFKFSPKIPPREEPKLIPYMPPREEPKLISNIPPREATFLSKTPHREEHEFHPNTLPKKDSIKDSLSLREMPKLAPKKSPKEEMISLVQYFNRIELDNLLIQYEKVYNKSFSLSEYGFSSLDECIEDIPELNIVNINNCSFIVFNPETLDNSEIHNVENISDLSPKGKNDDERSTISPFQSEHSKNQNIEKENISNSLKKKLQMVAKRYTEGIWSSEFPTYFEEATSSNLDLHSLGYRCLNDLIDDVPDIFTREPVVGSRKDYIIYPTNGYKPELNGPVLIDRIVKNLRKILEAYPEGIQVQELVHVYSINCRDTLHISDLGFDNLDSFLSSIKNHVPLTFDLIKGVKTVHLFKLSDNLTNSYNVAPEASQKEAIPYDAVFPDFKFELRSFPQEYDFSKYIPVYTSAVAHPGHLFIQIQDESAPSFIELAKNLNTFYDGKQSDLYRMKSIHIKVGASCAAQWPSDQLWYRAQILSIPSVEKVQVHYVDYGTRDTIPICLLRYLKKEFINLPAQALRCRLAYLMPPKYAAKWDIESSRNRILSLCEDRPLMAKIEEITPENIYSIILCDTNGKEDIYINDVLCKEGLAAPLKDTATSPEPVPVPVHNLNPLQALQAQYFLNAFAAVAPSFTQNENFIKLMREVTMYCSNTNPVLQNTGVSSLPLADAPPGFNTAPSNSMNSYFISNACTIPPPTSEPSIMSKYRENIPISPKSAPNHYTRESEINATKSFTVPSEENEDAEREIFDEDDDEIFDEFCEKASITRTRYVKRVMLGESYKIHIIIVESEAFASSGDICQFIWTNKEPNYLFRRLQVKEVDIPVLTLSEEGNETLFQQLERCKVRGIQKTPGFKDSILLYPLKVVIKILNIFGHPSVTLRTKLIEEIANFDLNNVDWTEFSSPEPSESEEEESCTGVTDDDKIDKLCLFDLLAMKESITLRKKKFSNTLINFEENSNKNEIGKLDQMQQKVLQRIKEIKEICNVFS